MKFHEQVLFEGPYFFLLKESSIRLERLGLPACKQACCSLTS